MKYYIKCDCEYAKDCCVEIPIQKNSYKEIVFWSEPENITIKENSNILSYIRYNLYGLDDKYNLSNFKITPLSDFHY